MWDLLASSFCSLCLSWRAYSVTKTRDSTSWKHSYEYSIPFLLLDPPKYYTLCLFKSLAPPPPPPLKIKHLCVAFLSTLSSVPVWLQEHTLSNLSTCLSDCLSNPTSEQYPHVIDTVAACLDGFPLGEWVYALFYFSSPQLSYKWDFLLKDNYYYTIVLFSRWEMHQQTAAWR